MIHLFPLTSKLYTSRSITQIHSHGLSFIRLQV